MLKKDFIKWVELSCDFMGDGLYSYRREVDYASCTNDYLDVEEDCVTFTTTVKYWGGSDIETTVFTFEDFINAYEKDLL